MSATCLFVKTCGNVEIDQQRLTYSGSFIHCAQRTMALRFPLSRLSVSLWCLRLEEELVPLKSSLFIAIAETEFSKVKNVD